MSGRVGDGLKVRAEHQQRQAFVYVRQSSLHQVRNNLEASAYCEVRQTDSHSSRLRKGISLVRHESSQAQPLSDTQVKLCGSKW